MWYGHIPDRDGHSEMMKATPPLVISPDLVPATWYIGKNAPRHMYQAPLGSCAIHSVIAAMRYNLMNSDRPDVALSRLQLYYDVRAREGTIGVDAGARIRDVVDIASTVGVAREELWQYDPNKWTDQPTPDVYADALLHRGVSLRPIDTNPLAMKAAIFTGRPVIIGIEVFKGFESDEARETGIVPMPSPGETPIAAHSMIHVGYGQKPGYFTDLNWWYEWGDDDFCYMPEAYFIPRYSTDNWSIDQTSGETT